MARLRRCCFALVTGLSLIAAVEEEPAVPAKIAAPLRAHLEKSSPGEIIPVVLILERQVTEEEKSRLFSQTDTPDKLRAKRRKRDLLIQELKRVATAEQSELLKLLNAWEADGQVRNVRPLWISNVIGLKARRSTLEQLATFQGIKSINLDIPRLVRGEVAWGINRIRADQVWKVRPRGYDGTGVVVAILDSGVSYFHPDLRGRMWINAEEDRNRDRQFTVADNDGVDNDRNGYVDDVVGWNFADSNNDPKDVGTHGTRVAGTVAGDGTGGTRTGVAPGAQIMALRDSQTEQHSTQLECWEGMQYALANGADIVNFSAGWLDVDDPVYDTWRTNVKNLMDGGVLFVTITHNDSNEVGEPNNVRTPGRAPAALTVGATDAKDVLYERSNYGPVTWKDVDPFFDYHWGPGLRKPDVVAPGVQIKSTVSRGGYAPADGTSFAAPHVAGLAALLLDKDPSLTPYELKLIIEETSVDLGKEGPDNVFGWGRIDALEAIQYRIRPGHYDLTTDRNGKDIWVDNDDDGRPDAPKPGTINHLYARIRNHGGQMVTNAEVRFCSVDSGSATCDSGTSTLLGSYSVPILGPARSRHDTALAAIHWEIPKNESRWRIRIEIAAHPPNPPEKKLSNNAAIREL